MSKMAKAYNTAAILDIDSMGGDFGLYNTKWKDPPPLQDPGPGQDSLEHMPEF